MAQWLNSEQYGNGLNGAYAPSTGTDAPVDSSCSGAAAGTELTATNASFEANQIILIHQTRGTGVGQWELNVIDSYTAGTITTKYALAYTYTDSGASQAQVLVLKQYSSALIDTGVTLTAKDWDGNVGGIIAFLCTGTTTITGNITGFEKGYDRGDQVTGEPAFGKQGEGTVAAGNTQGVRTANGSGGGGSDNVHGGGGGGGHATNGGVAETAADGYGFAGLASGTANLATATFGGGGGSGGSGWAGGKGGRGGNGGGLIFIFTNKLAEITGSISVNGGNASNGEATDTAGGGGAAGGGALIKCNTAVLGTSKITATAGSKGISGVGSGYGDGGDGAVGRVAVYYGTSYTGESNPAADFTEDSNLIPAGAAGDSPLFFGGAGAAIA